MKWTRSFLGVLLVVACTSMCDGHISAQTMVVDGGTLTIQSKVLKTHYVIVDEQSRITEITSNTNDEAVPRVFFQKIAPGNERPVTEDIYKQYRTVLPDGKATVGIVYTRSMSVKVPLFSNTTSGSSTDPLAFIKP